MKKRLPENIPSGEVSYQELIGAKVKVISGCSVQSDLRGIREPSFTIEDIKYRVTVDGKTMTLIKIKELPKNTFTLKDIEIISINSDNGESSEEG